MEPIILERADVRELAGELIKCGICTGSNLTQQIYDAWALWAAPIKYISSVTDTAYICPSRIAFRAGDHVATRQGFYFGMVQNSIDALVHEMYENCSVRPVCYSENDKFELREIEEMHAACEYIKNTDYQFLIDRAYELGVDAVHMHNDYIDGLQVVINGTDRYKVEFRVMYGDIVIGEIF